MNQVQQNLAKRRYQNEVLHTEFINDTQTIVNQFGFDSLPEETDKYAVILEPRPHVYFGYVLRNIMHFLGPGWGLQIVTAARNKEFIESITRGWSYVHVTYMDIENLTREQFRKIRKSYRYWQHLKGKHLLCFETDTLLCKRGIEDFLDYDYIGAPWKLIQAVSDVVRVGNGGLSLRSRTAMMDMCMRGKAQAIQSEDTFFSIQLHLHKDEYRLPTLETAKKFSVESLYYPSPLGIHKPWVYMKKSELLTIYDTIDYSS